MAEYFAHNSAYLDDGCTIGKGSRIWHFCHVMAGARIGEGCVLGQNVYVGGGAIIGNGVKIQNNVSVYDHVILEDDVFCGPSCVFTNVMNPRAFIERKQEYRATTVRQGASIGANATIVCGVTLGRYCFVGAGSVVAKDVKDFALVVGAPSRQIGWMSKAGVRLGSDLVCAETGQKYRKTGSGIAEADN